ncbi:hypothetical protein Tsubulata_035196, partial [Turnera subulata]
VKWHIYKVNSLIVFSILVNQWSHMRLLMALHICMTDDVCDTINCGQGTCIPSSSFPGFDCECDPGWKKIQIGPLIFPSCVIPNCTVDFGCGNGAPPPPPPPIAPLPPLNLSSPCNLVWCGDGTCVVNGNGHICSCYEGSSNLFNVTEFACFKQCYLGADCNGVGFSRTITPPPSKSGLSGSENGTTEASNSFKGACASTIILLAASILSWV